VYSVADFALFPVLFGVRRVSLKMAFVAQSED